MSGFDLSNFVASFFDEARERLNSINQALVKFESGTLDDEGLVSLRRDAHTIKGSALMLGVHDVGGIAHIFEDMVEVLIASPDSRTEQAIQFLYDLHDLLDKRLEDPDSKDLLDVDGTRTNYNKLLPALKSEELVSAHKEEDPALSLAQEVEVLPQQTEDFDEDTLHEIGTSEDVEVDLTTLASNVSLDDFLHQGEEKANHRSENLDTFHIHDDGKAVNLDELQSILDEDASLSTEVDVVSQADEQAKDKPEEQVPEQTAAISKYRPVATGEAQKSSGRRKSSGRFLRVDAERMEGLSNQVIEMSTEQNRSSKTENDLHAMQVDMRMLRREWRKIRYLLEAQGEEQSLSTIDYMMDTQMQQLRRMAEESRYQGERNTFVLRELRDQVLGLLVRPLDTVFSTFPRAVRDTATKIGKRVHLVVDGQTVEMDQNVTESLVEPLVHLLNNAVAHGLESEEERKAAGKPAQGQVSIIARQSGSEVVIEVIDDGRGIDTDLIKRVAVERGVTTQDETDLMDSGEIMELIFRPGFSTFEEVDMIAGRGIGMNVVQDAIRRLTGTIRVHTEVGKGTRFVISVPVSVAVQQALMFTIGGQQYGMLTHMIDQVLPYHEQKIQSGAGGKRFLVYGSEQVPVVDLRGMMKRQGSSLSKEPYVIVAEHIEGFVGIMVDDLLGDGETMVRDLDPYIKRYQPQGLMGNTIIEDGTVVMLLEPYGIKEMGRTAPDQQLTVSLDEEEKLRFHILLVDDSLIAREVEKSIFESLGFVVDTAIDGMDGLEKIHSGNYDMLVTDLEMPRLDGFGFVRQIRNQPKYEALPIVVISTRESAEDRMRALEVGADSYMVKQHLEGSKIISTVKALVGPEMVRSRGVEQEIDTPE